MRWQSNGAMPCAHIEVLRAPNLDSKIMIENPKVREQYAEVARITTVLPRRSWIICTIREFSVF
jgi:hypothetical protein